MHRAAILALGCLLPVASLAAETKGAVGQKVPEFSLRDQYGKVHALADYADRKVVVLAFLGNECPLARLYAARLKQIAGEYGPKGVAVVGVNANRQDALTEIAAFARQQEITFPILKDAGNVLADQLGAERTPELFVLDRDRVVRYQGRVDDQYGIGFGRPAATQHDLTAALDALLAGRDVRNPVTEAPGCLIGRVAKKEPQGSVTYTNQIARLLNDRCVRCHRAGEIAPFPLTSFDEVVGWAATIREVIQEGRMPPWFANPAHGRFANDARLSDAEKQLVYDWVDNGCPEGEAGDLPTPPHFAEGWQIPQPDLVLYIEDEPVKVAAQGVLPYRYFLVDPFFKEDKWVKAIECRPGNRAVVHHIIAGFIKPKQQPRLGLGGGTLVGYAPGMPPSKYPEGAALLVPAGSKVVFQVHYTPNGAEQFDRSCVGMVFADPSEVREKVEGDEAANTRLNIPPGEPNYEAKSHHTFREDARLVSLTPHMHMRGKSFRYEAVYPGGRREVLLDVPRYDFNWQLRYDLAEPKLLPKGTELVCTAHYDNSEANLSNPNPKRRVHWGDQTWDEMLIGYFTTLPGEKK
ncbi:MAG: redoxin domain-containing protein [Planctomycetia bacterium]|nr:redoxin domain-containing protein [Planctomycetia bacterium]